MSEAASSGNGLIEPAKEVFMAAFDGDVPIIEDFLNADKPLDINARPKNVHNCTLLFVAAEEGHEKLVDLLIARNANVDLRCGRDKMTALQIAVDNGHPDTVRALLRGGANPNIADKMGRMPLHWAAQNGAPKTTLALLQARADVDATTSSSMAEIGGFAKGSTALLMAVKSAQGASSSINLQEAREGHIDCRVGHVATVKELLRYGSSVTCEDEDGHSPASFAAARGMRQIEALFSEVREQPLLQASPNFSEMLEQPLLHQRVRIIGLGSRADLNGTCGVATDWLAKAERYVVQLDAGGGVRVRPSNLEKAATQQHAPIDVSDRDPLGQGISDPLTRLSPELLAGLDEVPHFAAAMQKLRDGEDPTSALDPPDPCIDDPLNP